MTMLRLQVRAAFAEPSRGAGRVIALSIQFLILVSIVTFCIETLPDLDDSTRGALRWAEIVCVAIFTAEYALRLWSAERPGKYALSFFGLIDLLAILPFYLHTGIDLRSIRVLRALRLVRILKFARHSRALRRLVQAIRQAREELVLYTFATLMLMFLASVGIYYCERDAQPEQFRSVFDAMWWSVATFTTVGYGDVYPVTTGGKLLTFVVLMLGLGIVAVPSAILASSLTIVKAAERDDAESPAGENESDGGPPGASSN